jgi:cysteine-rich repeat protein
MPIDAEDDASFDGFDGIIDVLGDADAPDEAADGEAEIPPSCGDGILDPGEACDDGNDVDTDACVACGDAFCGDGFVRDEVEACDDGNAVDGDGCRNDCTLPFCGDGILDPLEACDDGEDNSDDEPDACRTDCRAFRCGDGVTDTGEGCDDGNAVDGDGCRNNCSLATCGDRILDAGEDCDDGNDVDTDACLNTCRWATCGDRFVREGVEECDGDPPQACAALCGTTGTRSCTDCRWASACVPPAETCNGVDDDCDGVADNGFGCRASAPTSCTTTCGSTGTGLCTATCDLPTGSACAPPLEACNDLDDDCDGSTDNGFPCRAGSPVSCTTSCGSTGTGTCTASCALPMSTACTPPAETCNGVDDDCDGTADEGYPCRAGSPVSCATTCGSTGTGTCTAACAIPTGGACVPPAEACNGVDDDCDGTADEGYPCRAGSPVSCATTCGSTGTGTCSATCELPTGTACAPPAETCNGVDDDCDGTADEGYPCRAGSPVSCATGCGSTGTGTCTATCAIPTGSACTPPAETCNDVDDDCDTAIDNGYPCRAGTPTSCTTGCGSTGTGTCTAACLRPSGIACVPPAETCNGVDDDCDGAADEGYPCRAGFPVSCTTTCGSTGTGTCSATCAIPTGGACPVPAETCNGRDDDCDTLTDEGLAGCNDVCANATDISSLALAAGSTATSGSERAPCPAGCTGTAANTGDVWYRFTLAAREVVFLSLQDGNTWDAVLEVFSGTCGALTSVSCSDDACGNNRPHWAGSLAAGTYYVMVTGCYEASRGPFTLHYRHSPCPGALAWATSGATLTGNSCGAGSDTNGSCGGTGDEEVPYFAPVCPGTRTYTASTCADGQTWRSSVYIRSGSGGTCGGAELACGTNGSCGSGNRSRASGSVTGPELAFFVIDGGTGGTYCGDYGLTVTW